MVLEWDLDPDIEVPISAIEHYSYCPRQCALIHVEQTFDENLYTIRGAIAHERVESGEESAGETGRVLRAIPLWSGRLHVRGKADVVEMRPEGPYPVEYKVGRSPGRHAERQLCAQALCLEEMLGVSVDTGAIYSVATRRRQAVAFDRQLRAETIAIIEAIRADMIAQRLPPAPNDTRCRHCSLINSCLPGVVAEGPRMRGLQGVLFQPLQALPDDD